MIAAAAPAQWHFILAGWPIPLVFLLMAAAGWGIYRIASSEVGSGSIFRRTVVAIRVLVAIILAAVLAEPTLSRIKTEKELPGVVILLDASGSMGINDSNMSATLLLDEAEQMGMLSSSGRDRSFKRAGEIHAALVKSLSDLSSSAQSGDGEKEDFAKALELADELKKLLPRIAGREEIKKRLVKALDNSGKIIASLKDRKAAGSQRQKLLDELLSGDKRMAEICELSQQAADSALLSAVDKKSDVFRAVNEIRRMSRFERARKLTASRLLPLLGENVRPLVLAVNRDVPPTELRPEDDFFPDGQTDFEWALNRLAGRGWGGRIGAVILLSDGQQTAGGDPVPALRALRARGTGLGAIMIGDPGNPRDAAISGIDGATEIFKGEKVSLDVRFRIVGYEKIPWNLVLERDGKEVERHVVYGREGWQSDRFEFTADTSGLTYVQARLENTPGGAIGGIACVGYWSLDGREEKSARDFSGNNHHCSLRDIDGRKDRYAGERGGYLKFPLPTSVMSIDREIRAGDDWSFCCWFKNPLPATGKPRTLVAATDGQAHVAADKSMQLGVYSKNFQGCGYWLNTLPDGWHFLTAVGSGGKTVFYINGIEIGSSEAQVRSGVKSLGNIISGGQPFAGELDELAFFNISLSQQEIVQVMNLRGLGSNLASADDSPREATLDNNRVGKVISISEDPIRVLLVDAYPRWNSRFIMNIISRDKRISLTRIFRSISFGNGKTGLLPSTQEELDGYDAVILGDLKPEELAPEDAQRLANFVSRRGGFLVLLSGPRALPGSYMMGKLADVMPVRAVSSTYEEKPDGSPARLRLTTAGAHHPITGIFENPALNEKLWPELPGLYRISRRVFSKPGSEVLLETADEMRTPVVALSRYGAGRVLFMGAEDAWRWRDGIGGRVHQTFWLQALRWGLGMRLSGKDRRLQVSLSRRMLSPGEVAELQARATLSGGVASNGKIIVTIEKLSDAGSPMIGTVRELELSPHPDNPSIRSVSISGLDEGKWKISVASNDPRLKGLKEMRTLVVNRQPGKEAVELQADFAALERLAIFGGHRAVRVYDSEKLVNELMSGIKPRSFKKTETSSIWDNYLVMILITSLLAIEWVCRKRIGLP